MKICYQTNISEPTQELTVQRLKDLTEAPNTNLLIDCYRDFKKRMKAAELNDAVKEFVGDVVKSEDYKNWLKPELKKDEKRRRKHIPNDDVKRVQLYIGQKKSSLPATIPTATFSESTDRWGRKGLWRVQSNGYLTGLAVLDADHVPNPEAMIGEWLKREDFKEFGIVWIFITPSGEGIKVVFKAREEWGNLQDNAYTMAETLGVLDYADGQCKNADHAHFIPKTSDVKYIDWEQLFGYENPSYEAHYGEAYRRGESEPTQLRWLELEQKRKQERKGGTSAEKSADPSPTVSKPTPASIELTERDKAIIAALNAHYGDTLPEGRRHETWLGETAQWLLLLTDNNAKKTLQMGHELNYVKNWTDQTACELENCIALVQKKPLLAHRPKKLEELLKKAGIDTDHSLSEISNSDELPFNEWIEQIRNLV